MLLLIVIRIRVLLLLQIFYRNKHILKENERLLFQKYGTLHCTKTLLRKNLLSMMGEKVLRKKEKFNRCIMNMDCIQVLLL